jgi:hypothetical protein
MRHGILRILAVGGVALATGISPAHGYFGIPGQNGLSGRAGQPGRSGRDTTIAVDGTPQRIDLSGTDGGYGENAEYGRDAYNCLQPRPEQNVVGAPGGRGGQGGNGGAGGSGGDLTVYYENAAHLRNVLVVSESGRGGSPGQGAPGGRGCGCQVPYWNVQKCTTPKPTTQNPNPKPVCKTFTYRCDRGRDGAPGDWGRAGQDGSAGQATLIPQRGALQPEHPNVTIPLEQTGAGAPPVVSLSRNLWERRSGAATLFAPGSILASSYRIFLGRAEERATAVWADPKRPATDFTGDELWVEVMGQGAVRALTVDPRIWTRIRETMGAGVHTFHLERVLRESEAARVRFGRVIGTGTDLRLELIDDGALSDEVATRIQLKLEKDGTFGDKKLFEGVLPQELVTVTGPGTISVAVGRLPVEPKYLKPGVKLEYELRIARSFDGYSTEQPELEVKVKNP